MKKTVFSVFAIFFAFAVFAGGAKEGSATGGKAYPPGKVTVYGTGNPQFRAYYYNAWLERNQDIASGITFDIVNTTGAAEMREKTTMTYLSGAYNDLPDFFYIDPVNLMEMAKGKIVTDETDFVTPYINKMVDGSVDDAKYKGRIYGLPESIRPQVLFYNKAIFDKYGVDPALMKTMDGYIEAGRQLKAKSGGKVYLSYIDPGSLTWRYWGRRGLMPQANARIWDEAGNVVIGNDSGTKLALGALDTMFKEGLLIKATPMQPALYDFIRKGEVATFYIGAFWDEFLRKNVTDTTGQWRVMYPPVFKEIGTGGAPVSSYFAIVNKPGGKYAGLVEKFWVDFQFDNEARKTWVSKMVELNAPFANPVSLEMLKDPFWKEPSEFYGGQSFREIEGKCLANPSKNLAVTPQDAQADIIISAELEKYVAGNQTLEQAIANMDKNLKAKIGKAEIQN